MGFLDRLRKALGGGGSTGAGADASDAHTYWIYAQCRRCGEPLKARVDMRNDPSQSDDAESWIVRKGLVGSGARRCFQTVEVTLTFDQDKKNVIASEVSGGTLINEAEYNRLLSEQAQEPESPTEA